MNATVIQGTSRRPAVWPWALFLVAAAYALDVESAAVTPPIEETGEINGAEFRIDIPKDWNNGLVLWAHGQDPLFRPPRRLDEGPAPAIAEAITSLGYACAQSAFSRRGFALREGVLDTEALRRYFVRKYGRPYPTIIAGSHMGGMIVFDMIERFPEVYDGALAGGANNAPTLTFLKERVFDLRLLYDYFFPELPGSAVEFPEGERTFAAVQEKVGRVLSTQREAAERFCQMVNIRVVDRLPFVIAYYSEILRDLQLRAGGNAFDNRNTIYTGSDDDLRLNREIPRFKADARAVEYVRQWSTPTGRITSPILAINKLVDDVVPVEYTKYYGRLTQLVGTSDLFVQMYTGRAEGPSIVGAEIQSGLELLTRWITEEIRPTPGLLPTPLNTRVQ